MTESLLIGIDFGTTLNKVGIYDQDGNCIADSSILSKMIFPKMGLAEQDPKDFYESAIFLIMECVKKIGYKSKKVEGIAIDGQMGGIMAIDKNFNPVIKYDPPLDIKANDYGKLINIDYGKTIFAKTGAISTYGQKILYWLKEYPELSKRIYKFIQPADYAAGLLAGLSAKDSFIDHTYISWSGLGDSKKMEWSEELCNLFKVPINKLPKIKDPFEIIGKLKKSEALKCGLTEGIPIACGCGDSSASYLGAGAIKKGVLIDSSATACSIAATVDDFIPDIKNQKIAYLASAIRGLWHPVSFGLFGHSHRWFVDEFFKNEFKTMDDYKQIYAKLDEEASKISPGSNGLLFIPHLQGRMLPAQPNIRGAWVGFTWSHKREHFYRSILESAAYDQFIAIKAIKNLFPEIMFNKIRIIGGGAKSFIWNQIKSDVLDITHILLNRSEFATLGSAIIAGKAIGLFENIDNIIEKFVIPKKQFTPNNKNLKLYEKYANAYEKLLINLEGTYKTLAEIINFNNKN